jgi:hypothetical protein
MEEISAFVDGLVIAWKAGDRWIQSSHSNPIDTRTNDMH